MNNIQPVKGTRDLVFDDYLAHQYIINLTSDISECYGYDYIATPIIEPTEIFTRSLGETSDVVGKEMYSFIDKGGDNITLRPEFTAAITRAVISGGLYQRLPLKLFSYGPLFRRENPQKGRQRQFHQINAEIIGVESPKADAELIEMASYMLEQLGILKQTALSVNSLGCSESRANYRILLTEYFNKYKADLSADSKLRLKKNPLRILDSKDPKDKEIARDAPLIQSSLTDRSKKFFEEVVGLLEQYKIKFKINPHLVRGLDYYNHTAFEFVSDNLGAQGTVLGGGRYDGLHEQLGGKPTACVGFAAGVERIALLCNKKLDKKPLYAIMPIGDSAEIEARKIAMMLRHNDIAVEFAFNGNLGKRMKKADNRNAVAALIFGEDELANSVVKYRDMASGREQEVSIDKLLNFIKKRQS